MNLPEQIAFLRRYNAWRRGDETIEQPDPKTIGEALEAVCDALEKALEATPEKKPFGRED